MANAKCTALWQVREPFPPHQPKRPARAKVMEHGYPPLKSNPDTPWRRIPWINLKGYWLEAAGFEIGAQFSIEIEQGRITLVVEEQSKTSSF